MGEDFLDRLKPAEPARPAVTPSIAAGANATAYAAAALKGEVENLLAVPIGSGRNHQLNVSAFKMGQIIATGAIDERTVTEVLGAADGGLDYKETRDTIASGIKAGIAQGRIIPEPTHPAREVAPWEQPSDDPLSDNYVAPNASTTSRTESSSAASSAASGAATAAEPSQPRSEPASKASTDPAYDAAVAFEAGRLRLQRDARRRVDHEDALKTFRVPEYLPTLVDELRIPDEPVTYRVDRLIPTGGNVLLAAQFKAGKTTLVSNLARALADDELFLGRYGIDSLNGRVAIFNYEVDRAQYRRWLRDINIGNGDRVAVLPLRGYRLPLLVPHVEDWVVAYLQSVNAEVWIVDPFARAASGSVANENDNTEVGAFLEALDVIKRRAGVSELILPTHTGRAEHEQGDERARGATRLDDWADVRWLLTRDKGDVRYFRATGRDVDTDEAALAFDDKTRTLTITGGDRNSIAREKCADAVLTTIGNRPGIGKEMLRQGVRQILLTASNDRIDRAVTALIFDRKIHVAKNGQAHGHFLGAGPAGSKDPLE